MNQYDLQSAIDSTCGLLTAVPATHGAQQELSEHLEALLSEQKLRAFGSRADALISSASITYEFGETAPLERIAQGEVVLDPERSLMWTRRPISTDRLNFKAADAACASCRIDGHTDWRLPTREELQSLVDYNRYNPAINPELFPDTPPNYFWSSSPVASLPDYAWIVDFSLGYVDLYNRDGYAFVRAVRSLPASQ